VRNGQAANSIPTDHFQSLHPNLVIDDSVLVYQDPRHPEISALASAQQSQALLAKGQSGPALAVAREAVVTSPDNLITQTALGDAAGAVGDKQIGRDSMAGSPKDRSASGAWCTVSYIPDLESKIKRLSAGNE